MKIKEDIALALKLAKQFWVSKVYICSVSISSQDLFWSSLWTSCGCLPAHPFDINRIAVRTGNRFLSILIFTPKLSPPPRYTKEEKEALRVLTLDELKTLDWGVSYVQESLLVAHKKDKPHSVTTTAIWGHIIWRWNCIRSFYLMFFRFFEVTRYFWIFIAIMFNK